ncbi:MAG: IMP dehydrogenase [Ilumatobacteraceae bacterium]
MLARLVVLASGAGSNLQAVLDACADGRLRAEVVLVASDHADAGALDRARGASVPAVHVGRRPGEARADYDSRLADVVAAHQPDHVVLAGWMRILTMAFLDRFPGRVVNLHPALPGQLPRTHAIERAWHEALAGERTTTGVMVHLVPSESVDDGPVLGTTVVPIRPDDTLESLTARIHAAEHELLVTALIDLCRQKEPVRMNPNDDLFDRFEALTFDDVVIVPGYSETLPDAVDTAATFAAGITLAVPLISAAMDKVTDSRLAIAMARHGGIGVIHRNLTIDDQAAEVQQVKRSQSGMITDPVTLPPTARLHEAEALMHRFKFSGVPITDGGGRLVGILTNRDIRFCAGADFDRPITEFMTADGLVTAEVGTTLDEAKAILQRHRIEKLPLVDRDGRLAGLITVKDIQKRQEFPNASRDDAGRLRCAAAVGVGDDLEERVEALVGMGVDAVAIDTAHGHSAGVIKAIERIKGGWPDLAVVAGNVVTEDGVDALAAAGADAIKVGVGAGSICTTRVISGAGMPQLSAIWHTTRRARRLGVPIIADGGITYSGDIVKAIAAGAETAMLGSLLAGTEESPGEPELFEGRRYKTYRGMGSLGAMQGVGADRYASGQSAAGSGTRKLVPEGIEGRVAYAGSLGDVLFQLVGGLRSGMGYAGAATLESLRTMARFMRVTSAGRTESHPHDVQITNEAPNYQRGG